METATLSKPTVLRITLRISWLKSSDFVAATTGSPLQPTPNFSQCTPRRKRDRTFAILSHCLANSSSLSRPIIKTIRKVSPQAKCLQNARRRSKSMPALNHALCRTVLRLHREVHQRSPSATAKRSCRVRCRGFRGLG